MMQIRQMLAANVMSGTMREAVSPVKWNIGRNCRSETAICGRIEGFVYQFFSGCVRQCSIKPPKTDGLDMNFAKFEHGLLPRIVAPLLAGLLVLAASQNKAAAATPKTFVISPSEGYGVLDCISKGSACGRVVADAWCEANGLAPRWPMARPKTSPPRFRRKRPSTTPTPDSLLISCGE